MVIARSGSSVAETLAAGKPSVLIPSPNVAGNHQEHNARAVEKKGAAAVICEDKLNLKTLCKAADGILFDDQRLEKMSAAAKSAAITDAAERIYSILNEIKNKNLNEIKNKNLNEIKSKNLNEIKNKKYK